MRIEERNGAIDICRFDWLWVLEKLYCSRTRTGNVDWIYNFWSSSYIFGDMCLLLCLFFYGIVAEKKLDELWAKYADSFRNYQSTDSVCNYLMGMVQRLHLGPDSTVLCLDCNNLFRKIVQC